MYGKVFRQMYKGSMYRQGWEAIVTMQQFIVLADREGVVDMTLEAIAGETTIPIEVLRKGVQILSQADTGSRTPDEDGRRIVLLDDRRGWGWRLVNYAKYRKIQSDEDRREYHRQYWHQRPASQKKKKRKTQHASTDSIHAEAEAKAEESKNVPSVRIRASRKPPEDFTISEALRTWASENFPSVDLDAETAAFKDYTFASPKTDWPGTWRNWIRKASKSTARRLTKYEESMAELDRRSKDDGRTPADPAMAALLPNVGTQVPRPVRPVTERGLVSLAGPSYDRAGTVRADEVD